MHGESLETAHTMAHFKKDAVIAFLHAVSKKMAMDPAELAAKAGVDRTTLERGFKGDTQTRFKTLKRLSQISGLPLPGMGNNDSSILDGATGDFTKADFDTRMPIPPPVGRDLPIRGRAGASDLYSFEGALDLGYVERPHYFLGNSEAYALYCHGDSMSPRYDAGQLLYIDPHRPPSPGNDVIVILTDGTGFLKRLVRRTQKEVRFRQFNPDKEFTIPASQISAIHLVVSSLAVRA